MKGSIALSSLLFGLSALAIAQEPREADFNVTAEKDGYYVELGGKKHRIASAHSALEAVATRAVGVPGGPPRVGVPIRARASVMPPDGGLGGDGPVVPMVRLSYVNPIPERVMGRITPDGKLAIGKKMPEPVEGERSILLLASVQLNEVEVEGWRFSDGRPFLVSAIKTTVTSDGYLSRQAEGRSRGEQLQQGQPSGPYEHLGRVKAGSALWIYQLKLHERGESEQPYRPIEQILDLDLDADLDYDAEGAGDESKMVVMAYTRPFVSGDTGKLQPAGYIPLRKLDVGTPELIRKFAEAMKGIDLQRPPQAGLVQRTQQGPVKIK